MIVVLVHAAATWFMVGLIWFVQVVHYPLAATVGDDAFVAYQHAHMARTSVVVVPAMMVELAATGWLLIERPAGIPDWAPWLGAALLGVVWASTALLQVPAHSALTMGLDEEQVRRLVSTNWIRTIGWSLRGLLALALVYWATSVR